jgi:radical SAM superfamily enzyme YgiQ (UPF0313 family)
VLNLKDEDILDLVAKRNPSLVGISSITPTFHRALNIARKIKSNFPQKLIILGGHHATIMKEELLREDDTFDLIVHGEGEIVISRLLEAFRGYSYNKNTFLKDYNLLSSLEGIVYRKGEEIVVNNPHAPISDLDSLPDPAWELLPMEKYIPLPNQYLRKPVVHMIATRGCLFSCTFCSCNAVFGRKIRRMSPKRVIEAFRHANQLFGAREISFWDDTITVQHRWLEEFCDLILKEKIDVTWTCLARADTVNLKLLKLMRKAGCWNIFYGLEAGDQSLLDNINKGITLEQIIKAVEWTKKAGIEVRASFMLALPGETKKLAQKTINLALKLDIDYVQFCITTPYPGTKLYQEAHRWGKLFTDFSQYSIWSPVFVPFGYKNREEIAQIEREALRRFYLRPTYILKRIIRIRNLEDIRRYYKGLKMALGLINQ